MSQKFSSLKKRNPRCCDRGTEKKGLSGNDVPQVSLNKIMNSTKEQK